MNKKKVILLLSIKVREFDFQRYDLYEFEKHKNYEIEAHELIEYVHPGFSTVFTKKFSSEKVKKFSTFLNWKDEILKQKKKYKDNLLIINEIQCTNLRSLKINFFLKRQDFCTINFSLSTHPSNAQLSFVKKINWLFKNLISNKKKILLFLEKKISSIFYKILNLQSKYLLIFNKNYLSNTNFKKGSSIILEGNNRDYNMFLKNKDIVEEKKRYGIFLDSPTPAHNIGDSFINGDNQSIKGTKLNWLNSVNRFLRLVENKLNIEILIAPHPKIEYLNNKLEIYGGRELISGKLFQSAKNAKLIISRDSSGAAFAAIYKIPAIFIFTNELKNLKTNFLDHQKKFANEFGVTPVNIDEKIPDIRLKELLKFKNNYYSNYINKYCSARNDNKVNFEVISKILE